MKNFKSLPFVIIDEFMTNTPVLIMKDKITKVLLDGSDKTIIYIISQNHPIIAKINFDEFIQWLA